MLGIVNSLFEANKLLKKLIIKNDNDKIEILLQDMQAAAIEVGETIEKGNGEGKEAVQLLEELCELIWETSQPLSSERNRFCKEIHKKLEMIREQIVVIPERTEVVFLPYKASMWDSLESVWMAARDDENCDAYVIPIPYYDKNPDGSFKEVHYEAEEYPDYVPITHYNDYDFSGHHPDTIFFHNPYDDCNFVTSVHPFFYSSNIKQFTEQLVYIPYFVLSEISPDNKEAIEKIQHFCTVPGVFNADKVIVQSEDMRKIYVNILTEETERTEWGRAYWEEKILGLGSPKMDKVTNTCKEDLQIPEEWMKVVQKTDGSRKKIILYNTGVDALLKHSDKMLGKIKDVLRVFKENQDEVALLWRPHPLIKATIGSMRPELWKEYRVIVEQYCEEGWGIYDDTADMDRALALSDAYYGDGSSLVQLYQRMEKPAMIQDVEIRWN